MTALLLCGSAEIKKGFVSDICQSLKRVKNGEGAP